jgi:putative Mn2+ efflux pump MntP
MKTKQLANILIKVLGLSLCVQSVMHFVTGIFNILVNSKVPFLWSNFVSGAILAGIGILFIVQSREVASFLFKNDEE